ncbi:MAG: hypothetical protein MUF78_10920 [Candidatus Edwardsbacteria bacterium]|jgi:hypothetical protein|nr:hypothetical protein [Candidatus Edwardsbacteria bacterium]
MAAWETLLKPSLDLLRAGLKLAGKQGARRRYQQLLSAILRELLKGSPDFDLLEARWGEIEKLGVLPDRTFIRARRLYTDAVKRREVKSIPSPRAERTPGPKRTVKRKPKQGKP